MRIYVIQFPDLENHLHIYESELKKDEYIIQLEKKYVRTNLKFIYSAEISESIFRNHSRTAFLKKHESVYGDYLFQVSIQDALLEMINYFTKDFEVDKEYEDLVLDYIAERELSQKKIENKLFDQKKFINQYNQQYKEINGVWEKFWDSKYPEFEMFVKNNNYPKREKSIFFQKSLDDQYRIEAQAYTSRYEKLIKDWRKETISLPSKLVFQCPYCNKDTEVNFKFNGPGYSVGIRGDNMNTIQKTEEITTDMLQEIKRLLIQENNLLRRKLKPNHKYHWRNIISLTGKCTSCEKNIFMDHGLSSDYINFNFINTSFGTSSIYPYYDSESAKEFHGVWGTFYSYLALDYKNNTK